MGEFYAAAVKVVMFCTRRILKKNSSLFVLIRG
jgi:hypothetical protein